MIDVMNIMSRDRPRSERDQHREDPNSEAHRRKHMELQQAETRRRMYVVLQIEAS